MKNKNRVNINLALSKSLLDGIKLEAEKQELAYSALIRLILQAYLDNRNGNNTK
jgi:predicted DNA binding CopG/RHH family protein